MATSDLARAIGANIAAERKARNVTQGWLADRLGIGQSRLSNIESGCGTVGVESLLRITEILDCPLLTLIKGAGSEPDAYRKGYEDGWRAAGNAMHAALVKGTDAGAFGASL